MVAQHDLEELEKRLVQTMETALTSRDEALRRVEEDIDAMAQQVATLLVAYGEIAVGAEALINSFLQYAPEEQRKGFVKDMNERREAMLKLIKSGGPPDEEEGSDVDGEESTDEGESD